MRLLGFNGKLVNKNVSKYVIDWNKKSLSIFQFRVKQFLKPFWQTHIMYEEFPVYQSRMHVDILNATLKIAIECDGNFHNEFNKFFHNNSPSKYLASIKNDMKKEKWLDLNGYKIVRINEDEIDLLSKDFFKNKFDLDL